ncbi:thioredoxin domain-containing protein [Breoghania sp. L-A4]|uniref:thioredoxin domain-containing protein n=1 Tax=Breoghania sp. L-A4 TaxID=2304600 RepID=UPI000E35C01E|nr:thioredoxin domain-containing protein [Breoghania sp. L-A4]AXS42450.1 twin-arginine translocation signal domain-containing protein [Breoghania sp. L-A4]
MRLSRRDFLEGSAATALCAALVSVPTLSWAKSFDVEALGEAGPLGEKTLGDPSAPNTVIEYASLTCGHCRNFHTASFPHLKKEYVDTGKVYFIFRDFPLDNLAFAAAMLARCAPEDKYFSAIDLFFEQQKNWAFTQNPLDALKSMAKQIGFSEKTFEECLKNQEILDGLNWVRDRANTEFGVNSTPTFFINGEQHRGALSVEELDKILG